MKRTLTGCAALIALLFGGCSSPRSAHSAKPDQPYENAMDTGKSVYEIGQSSQAEAQYRTAMDRALMRDDAVAIHEAGFNLATVLLAQDQPRKTLQSLGTTEAALSLRNYADTSDLAVIRAAALYRLHDTVFASQAVERALKSPDSSIRERALYLSGLIAADLKQNSVLASRVADLASFHDVAATVDRLELTARLNLLQMQPELAYGEALSVAQKRRDSLDYRGMRRALSLAADAAEAAGHLPQAQALRQQESISQQIAVKQAGDVPEVSSTPGKITVQVQSTSTDQSGTGAGY
ncbi:hypothetical protein [Gluconobacter kanchanaburiensis]|uniref:Lipoprotein n=1 Tax=Gluconobacter kanchanaburiensis NBRC 103587 TaxID=1307948 RepID=A0A511BEC7_9PROT|nr:hypothetical protein [Gluconobacter kanchanaburiensis]MBF0860584.1 hypothetical protein [Gluconobacter kanchanaburiensis]GBR69418.1 hypothetical protein AA103587_1312 [Gluconobacter kanchanaburiensis NBRC 103587]GEK96157.1 hypothetical protein GKA01_13540 [Gluconobacter kanchanaburiensis NBRC 103587]